MHEHLPIFQICVFNLISIFKIPKYKYLITIICLPNSEEISTYLSHISMIIKKSTQDYFLSEICLCLLLILSLGAHEFTIILSKHSFQMGAQ